MQVTLPLVTLAVLRADAEAATEPGTHAARLTAVTVAPETSARAVSEKLRRLDLARFRDITTSLL
jgi:hypothetical protein